MGEKFYITTPIYYPSAKLTIGNAYTTLLADTYARYHRLKGEDVCFLTGTDEHGQKIQEKAEEAGKTPKEFVDEKIAEIKSLWQLLNISYDRFIRTTDEKHKKTVQEVYQRLYDQGDIYKGSYKGMYCTPCEAFFTATQAKDGMCPDCGRPLEETEESCYFFKLSAYCDKLLQYFEEHPDFIKPAHRAKELIKNFIEPGLEDLAVSRSTFDWGIRLPFDEEHISYVWIDALSNYFSALDWPFCEDDDSKSFEKYWAPDLQLLGKDIVRFHGLIWPILLMALDLPQPECLYAHGWLLNKGDKMSKSKGNVMDPVQIAEIIPVDGIRYYVLSEMGFGEDGNYDPEALVVRCNSFMANDLGNLMSRTSAMIRQNFAAGFPASVAERYKKLYDENKGQELLSEDKIAAAAAAEKPDVFILSGSLLRRFEHYLKIYEEKIDELNLPKALEALAEILSSGNKLIDETKPWVLAKSEDADDKADLALVLYTLADLLYKVAIMAEPFVPETAEKYMDALGFTLEADRKFHEKFKFDEVYKYGKIPVETAFKECPVIYARLKPQEAIKQLEDLNA